MQEKKIYLTHENTKIIILIILKENSFCFVVQWVRALLWAMIPLVAAPVQGERFDP